MAGSALKPVQAAIFALLIADATLRGLLTGATVGDPRIYDAPKENQAFPYVVIGDAEERSDDTMGATRKQVEPTITVWSRYQGMLQVEEILDRIALLLDGAALSITGYQLARCVHLRSAAGRLQDGVTRFAGITFRLYVRQV